MWDQGGQPWQQWPLNQQQWMQSFQHQQDPSQIDWAALAQAWIAQREASGQQSIVEQPPGMMPNGQDMSAMESGPNNHGNFQGDSNFNRMWQPDRPQVQCVRTYKALQPDELTLEKTDILAVKTRTSDGWLEGVRLADGEKGWVPQAHVVEISSLSARLRNLREYKRVSNASSKLGDPPA